MPPAKYITYRELFDRIHTAVEVTALLAGLNAFSTVLLCSRLNTMFRHAILAQDEAPLTKFQQWFAAAFFDEDTRQRLTTRFGNQESRRRPVCHPLQFLNAIRLALVYGQGAEDTRPDTSQSHRHQLGTACLMISDILVTEAEGKSLQTGSKDERRLKVMAYMVSALEISKPTPFRNLLLRSYVTYKIALQDPGLLATIKQECRGLDFEKRFEEVVGTPLMGWLSLLFGVHAMLTGHSQDDFKEKPETLILNRKTLLQKPTLSQAQVDDFFDAISSDFGTLKLEMSQVRPVDERLDIVPFKIKPLLQTVPDNYACIDVSLVTEKLHNGPYFLLGNRLVGKEREDVFKAWGFLFETYINWLLKSIDGRHCASLYIYTDTHWEGGDKSFDAVFVKAHMVVVMEFKSGFLAQNARYSNDVAAFVKDLEVKYGGGCQQLARDIRLLFSLTKLKGKLRDVPIPTNTEWVMPVMIVQDQMLITPLVNYFLNQRFQSELGNQVVNSRVQILPLNVIQITNLESLVEMADCSNLDVIAALHRRCRQHPLMDVELEDFLSDLPEAQSNRCSQKFQAIFEKCTEEMCAFLFKDYSGPPT